MAYISTQDLRDVLNTRTYTTSAASAWVPISKTGGDISWGPMSTSSSTYNYYVRWDDLKSAVLESAAVFHKEEANPQPDMDAFDKLLEELD